MEIVGGFPPPPPYFWVVMGGAPPFGVVIVAVVGGFRRMWSEWVVTLFSSDWIAPQGVVIFQRDAAPCFPAKNAI
jgi:hypothetical protein